MKKTILAIASFSALVAGAATASAGGQEGSIGLGGEIQADGTPAFSMNYDAGALHIGGAFSFVDPAGEGNTHIGLGGRAYFHIHSTAMSDLGLGGQLDLVFNQVGGDNDDDDTTELYFVLGIQARAFVATNVALSGTAGLQIGAVDADGLAVGGDPVAAFGFHYYFF